MINLQAMFRLLIMKWRNNKITTDDSIAKNS